MEQQQEQYKCSKGDMLHHAMDRVTYILRDGAAMGEGKNKLEAAAIQICCVCLHSFHCLPFNNALLVMCLWFITQQTGRMRCFQVQFFSQLLPSLSGSMLPVSSIFKTRSRPLLALSSSFSLWVLHSLSPQPLSSSWALSPPTRHEVATTKLQIEMSNQAIQ